MITYAPVLVGELTQWNHRKAEPPGDGYHLPMVKEHFPVVGLHWRLVRQEAVDVCVGRAQVRPNDLLDLGER